MSQIQVQTTPGSMPTVPTSFVEDAGTAVPALNVLHVNGTAAQGITTSGATNVVTITASNAATAQKGVVALATNAETIAGTDTAKAVTADDLKAKLGTQTLHGLPTGTGTAAAIAWTAEPANGQILIGSTGNAPVLGTITQGSNITVTNAAGTITIAATGGGVTWSNIGASGALVVNTGYIANAGAALSFSLPATSAVGKVVALSLDGATSWTITQGANQQIRFGALTTTLGAGGSLASTAQGDTLTLVCKTADLLWVVVSAIGNITVV